MTGCGTSRLGELNDVTWYSDEPMPPEWQALVGGVTIVYMPANEPGPGRG